MYIYFYTRRQQPAFDYYLESPAACRWIAAAGQSRSPGRSRTAGPAPAKETRRATGPATRPPPAVTSGGDRGRGQAAAGPPEQSRPPARCLITRAVHLPPPHAARTTTEPQSHRYRLVRLSMFVSFLLFALSSSVNFFRGGLAVVSTLGFEPPLLAPSPGPLTVVVLAAAAACCIEFSELAHGDPEPAEALCGSVNRKGNSTSGSTLAAPWLRGLVVPPPKTPPAPPAHSESLSSSSDKNIASPNRTVGPGLEAESEPDSEQSEPAQLKELSSSDPSPSMSDSAS